MTAGGVEVELVEDAPVERPSSPKRLLIVLAAVLALTSVAWVVSARVQAAERAALLAERGFAPSLADPVVAAWEAPTFGPLLDDGSRLVGTAGETLIAVDLVTGEVAWSLDPRGSCQPVVDGEAARDVWPVSAAGAEALLWCQVRAGQPTDLVLDPADGSTVARVQTPGRPLVATVQEGDVVRLHDLGGQLTWQRWSLTGALRWSGGTTDAVLDTAWGTASIEAGGAYATVTGTRTVVVDLATGREVDPAMVVIGGTVDRRVVSRTADLPDGGRAEERLGTGLLPQVAVVDGAGRELWASSGDLARPQRDDGSAPWLVLVRSGGVLTARDAATGERLWAFTEPVRPAVLVSGVLVAQGAGEVIALDLADGTVLWRADLAGEEQTMVLAGTTVTSDGTLVVCQDGTSLVARGLADGRERWRSPLPDGALWSAVLSDGTLVVGGAGRLSALR